MHYMSSLNMIVISIALYAFHIARTCGQESWLGMNFPCG